MFVAQGANWKEDNL